MYCNSLSGGVGELGTEGTLVCGTGQRADCSVIRQSCCLIIVPRGSFPFSLPASWPIRLSPIFFPYNL